MSISLEKPNSPRLNKVERWYIKSFGMIQFIEHYKRVQSYNCLNDFILENKRNDGKYFNEDTIEIWGSKHFHVKETCFIDRVYSPSWFFLREGPKYRYKVMVLLNKGRIKNWAICDSMRQAKKEQKDFLKMNMVDIEKILNPIF